MADPGVAFSTRDLDFSKARNFAPQSVHIFRDMHVVVSWLQITALLALNTTMVVVGLYDASYFRFGPPVAIRDDEVTGTLSFWLLWVIFMVDRVIASLSAVTVGGWRSRIAGTPQGDAHPDGAYGFWTIMGINFVDYAVGWLRFSITVVFMYAQISFALAFFIGDFVVHLFVTTCHVRRLRRLRAGDDAPGWCERGLAKITPGAMALVEFFVALPLLLTAFFVSGYVHTTYFDVGPPVFVFGLTLNADWAFGLLLAYTFVDQLVASTVAEAFGAWETSELHNNAVADMHMSDGKARALVYSRILCRWLREVLVITLTLSQFIFTVAFFAADFLVKIVAVYREIVRATPDTGRGAFSATARKFADALPNKTWAIVVLEFECLVLLIVTGATGLFTAPYFHIPPPLRLFASQFVITQDVFIVWLCGYVIYDRVVATLSRDISSSYIVNVVVGGDTRGIDYHGGSIWIIAVNNIYTWARRVVAFNFILSNILFVLLSAFADIVATVAINERYIAYKRRMRRHHLDESQRDAINAREARLAADEADRYHINDLRRGGKPPLAPPSEKEPVESVGEEEEDVLLFRSAGDDERDERENARKWRAEYARKFTIGRGFANSTAPMTI